MQFPHVTERFDEQFVEKIVTNQHVVMKTNVFSLILSDDIADTTPDAMLTTLERFADLIKLRHFVTMTETMVMNVSGCAITCFKQRTTAWIVVFCATLRGYDQQLERPLSYSTCYSWEKCARSVVHILRRNAVTIGVLMKVG